MTYSVRDMLRERRKALGWSIRRAADETGIPYGTLGQYETGFAQPPLIGEVVCDFLDCTRAVVEVARLRQ